MFLIVFIMSLVASSTILKDLHYDVAGFNPSLFQMTSYKYYSLLFFIGVLCVLLAYCIQGKSLKLQRGLFTYFTVMCFCLFVCGALPSLLNLLRAGAVFKFSAFTESLMSGVGSIFFGFTFGAAYWISGLIIFLIYLKVFSMLTR